ncbi:hypothetical protein GUITHDRAFT_121322 [Guillardia theta CCMP2712]|uniref:Uncharacterized protein n=1 Tax=Guillardia theta (strain CCMP2712) TaxID=905079 RepID=L1I8E4_GUITC|nr:hypothetical protein GUITHDRAFT_121322 [Guillardia theta CCMP2712]EKX32503.1 hypothetical protein GUITHDRAFT_121322 [Guillardia theta CCMP2712]|eukprot:XP_005819483.1 hypothetical protein GUITHDRAFT_121322 [Guillardia theta CCMP2712]
MRLTRLIVILQEEGTGAVLLVAIIALSAHVSQDAKSLTEKGSSQADHSSSKKVELSDEQVEQDKRRVRQLQKEIHEEQAKANKLDKEVTSAESGIKVILLFLASSASSCLSLHFSPPSTSDDKSAQKILLKAKEEEKKAGKVRAEVAREQQQANEMRANAAKLKKESEEAKTKFVDTEKPMETATKKYAADQRKYRQAELKVANLAIKISKHPGDTKFDFLAAMRMSVMENTQAANETRSSRQGLEACKARRASSPKLDGKESFSQLAGQSVKKEKQASALEAEVKRLTKESKKYEEEADKTVKRVKKLMIHPEELHEKAEADRKSYKEKMQELAKSTSKKLTQGQSTFLAGLFSSNSPWDKS